MNTQPEVKQLITEAKLGESQAIDDLVMLHRADVYRLAISLLDDPTEADEATQDALLSAVRALPSFRGESSFSTWLYRITLNVCHQHLRRRRTRDRLISVLSALFPFVADRYHPEETAAQNESERAVWQGIRALGIREREVITLRYYHALPIAEIAKVLNVSERTVHNRLHTAHERLRTLIQREVETP
jgi:RNA polymerase sigma-70 factor (ECF subfamily)